MAANTGRSTPHPIPLLAAAAALLLAGCTRYHPEKPQPVADPLRLVTLPDLPVDLHLSGSDPTLSGLTFTVAMPPSHGALTGTPPALTYTPAAGWAGKDAFTFTVTNREATSAPGTVTIDVLPTTGPEVPGGAALDRLMVRSLSGQLLGGASLAVAKDGKLVYARGFGYADEAGALFEPTSLVRSGASFAFPAVEVLRLADAGQVSLDVKLLGSAAAPGLLYEDFPLPAGADARLQDITLRQVLDWSSGLTSQDHQDLLHPLTVASALGVPSPPTCRQMFQYSLRLPLEFTPGTSHDIAWVHNCLLGVVIEKVTGQDAQAVVRATLAGMGINDVRLGGARRADRAPGEVAYFTNPDDLASSIFTPPAGATVPTPYGGYPVATYATYLASAVDMVRYAERLQGRGGSSPLTPASLEYYVAPSTASFGVFGTWDRWWSPAVSFTNGAGVVFWGEDMIWAGFYSSVGSRSDGWSFAFQTNTGVTAYPTLELLDLLTAGFAGSATDLYPDYPSPALPAYAGQ